MTCARTRSVAYGAPGSDWVEATVRANHRQFEGDQLLLDLCREQTTIRLASCYLGSLLDPPHGVSDVCVQQPSKDHHQQEPVRFLGPTKEADSMLKVPAKFLPFGRQARRTVLVSDTISVAVRRVLTGE